LLSINSKYSFIEKIFVKIRVRKYTIFYDFIFLLIRNKSVSHLSKIFYIFKVYINKRFYRISMYMYSYHQIYYKNTRKLLYDLKFTLNKQVHLIPVQDRSLIGGNVIKFNNYILQI